MELQCIYFGWSLLASDIVIIEGLLFKHGIYSEFLFAQNYKQKPTIQQIQTSYRCASVFFFFAKPNLFKLNMAVRQA